MEHNGSFRVRFRFRLGKKLNISSSSYQLAVGGRDVVLSAQQPGSPISDSDWLVMNARAFDSEEEAAVFARALKAACEVSSVGARLGIDSGTDSPTSSFAKAVRERIREQSGIVLRNPVHGVDVFPDDPNTRFAQFSATGRVLMAPDPFLADINDLVGVAAHASQEIRDIVLLLNYALMRPEPVAQIVFAFSAVEMLGQNEEWNAEQRRLLDQLALYAETLPVCSLLERVEVAEAIRKGVHKLSLRQGVLRLLSSLGLDHLKTTWDELYGERSSLVHGLAPKPGATYDGLASRTVSLCGHILLKAVGAQVAGADRHANRFYKPA